MDDAMAAGVQSDRKALKGSLSPYGNEAMGDDVILSKALENISRCLSISG
jgi:hypothetical protein